jgi:hypothetical protein
VKVGQPVDVALELYPGRIFRGKVEGIWIANGEGQYIPRARAPRGLLPTKSDSNGLIGGIIGHCDAAPVSPWHSSDSRRGKGSGPGGIEERQAITTMIQRL